MGFFDFLGAVGDIIGQIAQIIAQIFLLFWNALVAVFTFVWNTLVAVVNAIVGVFQTVGQFFKDLWQNYIKPGVVGLIRHVVSVIQEARIYLKIFIDLFQHLMDLFNKYIYPWIKLVLHWISVARVFLSALRLLGVKWAAKLDADLAKIQGFITGILQNIVGTMNGIISILQMTVDPFAIFRKDFFTGTLFSNIPALRRAMGFGRDRGLTADEAQKQQDDRNLIHGGSAVLTRNADGSLTYSAPVQDMLTQQDAAMKEYGLTPPPH